MISLEELKRIVPYAGSKVALYYPHLIEAMREFEINSIPRVASFIAQLAHESGSFQYVREIASGEAYEGRADLGNTESGDGVRYKGRGLIQITGRSNYRDCGAALGVDLLSSPELLESPELACRSAAWFWKSRGLNEIADKGDFKLITRRINGGYNGYQDRLKYYERAQQVMG